MRETITIGRRYCGPPNSANGGYCAGKLATFLEGDVQVRLLAPPPLNTPLAVSYQQNQAELLDQGQVVATAALRQLSWEEPPRLPSIAEIEAKQGQCRAFNSHPFPGCFVCGPERRREDGLCIYPGPLAGGICAALWRPDESCLEQGTDVVGLPFVWAALDCPSSFPLLEPEENQRLVPMVLASLAVSIKASLSVRQTYRILSWARSVEGRKGFSRAMIFDVNGDAIAYSEALWISLNKQ
ncbi:MAG TPA: hypothetical protein DCZ03_10305 [Gammaproteobacteria bacterium]|nr:hypothetical protein [Gammaproteobacteria bacterium]